jgi:hypothetical protein
VKGRERNGRRVWKVLCGMEGGRERERERERGTEDDPNIIFLDVLNEQISTPIL